MVDRRMEDFFIGKKNHKFLIYDFYQGLSLANAYLRLKGGAEFDKKKKALRSIFWKKYMYDTLLKSMKSIDRTKYNTNEDWSKEVKKHYSIINKAYFDRIIHFIDEDHDVIDKFNKIFAIESKKDNLVFKKESPRDRTMRYSGGIIVRR